MANDQLVSAVKHIRALRAYSSSLQSAGDRRAAREGKEASQPAEAADRAPLPRSREGEHPRGSTDVKEQEGSSEESLEESGESSPGQQHLFAKSDPARRPPEPELPPIVRRPDASRKRPAPEEPAAAGEVAKKKKKNKDKRDRRGNRGGRNHPRLYRALEDPSIRVHRRPPASHWDAPDRLRDDGDHRRSHRDGR